MFVALDYKKKVVLFPKFNNALLVVFTLCLLTADMPCVISACYITQSVNTSVVWVYV